MGEIRYKCEVAGKSSILDGCLKKSFSSVYDLGKRFFGHPSRIDDFPCNLTQFCYNIIPAVVRGVGKGGGGRPGSNLIHFLYKVLGKRSVQKEPFEK